MQAQLLTKVSWLWRTCNNLQKNPPGFSLLWCHYPIRGQHKHILIGFHVLWQVLSSYSRILSFLGECPTQIRSCCQGWQHHLSQSKHKYRGRSVSKIKASTLGLSSKQTNVMLPGARLRAWRRWCPWPLEKSLHPVQGAEWALHGSACYWATCWHSNQAQPQNHGIVWAGRHLKNQLNPTPLSRAGTFFPTPACSKPHHVRHIPQRALWKAHTGTSKADLSIHITCIPVNDSIFMH